MRVERREHFAALEEDAEDDKLTWEAEEDDDEGDGEADDGRKAAGEGGLVDA